MLIVCICTKCNYNVASEQPFTFTSNWCFFSKKIIYPLQCIYDCPFRYQFNPGYNQTNVTAQILLKALTNLPHTDFTLCKCLIDTLRVSFISCTYSY